MGAFGEDKGKKSGFSRMIRDNAPIWVLITMVGLPLIGVAATHQINEAIERWRRGERDAGVEVPITVTMPAVAGWDPNIYHVPEKWLPSSGRECFSYRGQKSCAGPRKAPLPHGEAAKLGEKLELGTAKAALVLMRYGPPQEWTALIKGEPTDAYVWPVKGGKLWRGFGFVRREQKGIPHNGVDIGAPAGSLIVSVANGLVGYSDNKQPGYGNLMVIAHKDGTVGIYAHCRANYVFPGELVRAGQVIGEVGSTGIAKGAHLHFEVRTNGKHRDPLPYLTRGMIENGPPVPTPPAGSSGDDEPHPALGLEPDAGLLLDGGAQGDGGTATNRCSAGDSGAARKAQPTPAGKSGTRHGTPFGGGAR